MRLKLIKNGNIMENGVRHSVNSYMLSGQGMPSPDLFSRANLTDSIYHNPRGYMTKVNKGVSRPNTNTRFNLIPFKDIIPKLANVGLISGILPENGLVVVYGAPKCGKTFFALDMALHIALGWSYRGRAVKQGTVVYIVCEGANGIANRIDAFRQYKLLEDTCDVPFLLLPARVNLVADVQKLIEDISEQLLGQTVSLVVIDTLNRSFEGSESNDADMGAYIKAADTIREYFDCVVMPIHHCGYDSSHPRGHTSLSAAIDAQLSVKQKSGIISTTVELIKDDEAGAIIESYLEIVEIGLDTYGNSIKSCIISDASQQSEKQETINEIIEWHETGISNRAIASKLNINRNQVNRVVKSHLGTLAHSPERAYEAK